MSELGIYTSILNVSVPSSANPGDPVHIAVQIQNITPNSVDVDVVVAGLPEILDLGEQVLGAWDFKTFEGNFVMPGLPSYPSGVVTLYVRSMVWTGSWYNDAELIAGITIGTGPGPATWQKLGEVNVAVAVLPVSTGAWQKLAVVNVAVSPGLDLTGYNLIKQLTFPDGATYSGPAQEVTSYFEAPEISWVEDRILSAFIDSAADHGAGVLAFKLYQKPGFIIGHYILVLTGYQKAAARLKGAVAFLPPLWAVIILAALAILLIVAATFFVASVTDLVWGPKGKASTAVSTGLVIGGIALVTGLVVLPQLKKKPT